MVSASSAPAALEKRLTPDTFPHPGDTLGLSIRVNHLRTMSWRPRSGVVLLLGTSLVLAGCLGPGVQDPDPPAPKGPEAEADEPEVHGSAAASRFVALTLGVAVEDESVVGLEVEAVTVFPLLEAPSALLTEPRTIAPGTRGVVAAFAVEAGTVLPPAEITLVLHDGLGQARFVLEVPGWTATEDAHHRLTFDVRAPGEVRLQAFDGPLPLSAPSPTPERDYGLVLWPDGSRQVVPDFRYTVELPESFPRPEAGREARFTAEGASPPDWYLDGTWVHRGEVLDAAITPGRHTVLVDGGETGGQVHLSFGSVDRARTEGTGLLPTGPVNAPVGELNGNTHPFGLHDQAKGLTLVLSAADPSDPLADLDLYLFDPSGVFLTSSTTAGSSVERIHVDGAFEPGTYEVWVHVASGLAVPYVLETEARY